VKTTTGVACAIASLFLGAHAWADTPLLKALREGDEVRAARLVNSHAAVNERDDTGATALMWAAQRSNVDLTQRLLEAGANPNLRDKGGLGPLQIAVENRASAIALALIEHGADARSVSENGETALMAAAKIGDTTIMQALLDHHADVNAREQQFNQTALMWAAGHPAAVRLLLQHGASISARTKTWKVSEAVYKPRYRPLDANPWLHEKEYQSEKGGQTPLFFAIQADDVESVKALLDAGANVNDRSADGNTPLLFALTKWNPGLGRRCDMHDYPVVFDPNPAIANLLLDRGASSTVKNGAGYTPLHGAALALVPRVKLNEFCRLPSIHIDEVKDTATASVEIGVGLSLVKRLVEAKADPNAQVIYPVAGPVGQVHISFIRTGSSALHIAASTGNVALLSALLDHGGNPDLIREDGHSPLSLAVQVDSLPLVQLLASRGVNLGRTYTPADPIVESYRQDGTTDAKPRGDQTLLHIAAAAGASSVVPFLASKGLSMDAKDSSGETPLMLAESQERYRFERDRRDADLHRREGVPDIRDPESITLANQTSQTIKRLMQADGTRTANTLK
jgi:ankyrin repeat protein